LEVSDIVDLIDIAEYISQYCDLSEKGDELWGLSPFKDENTPSFSVCPDKGCWYDFSAGFGGNLIDFVMRYHQVGLSRAVHLLKQYAHITDKDEEVVVRIPAIRIAKKYANHTKPPRESTAKVLPPDCMERYEFRRDKLKLWADEGISWDVMRLFGVRYDALDDRIVYSVKNYQGDIINVCGRTCDPDFKAKKLRKYTYFHSLGTIDTLYGFSDNEQAIMEKKEIILFEGAKSVMLAYGWGIQNTAALLTSHLSQQQFNFLVKLGNLHGVRIIFALDSEVDITRDENICRLASFARVEWMKNFDDLLKDKDSPTDQGYEVFMKLYEGRRTVR